MGKGRLIGYWAATAVIGFTWVAGGVADLMRWPDTLAGMVALGYPPYVLTILGFWKILGAAALLAPGFPRLKEWAYVGTILELTGAMASHVLAGSNPAHLIWPAFCVVCLATSWVLLPPNRGHALSFTAPATLTA